jgi:hypothetical protein
MGLFLFDWIAFPSAQDSNAKQGVPTVVAAGFSSASLILSTRSLHWKNLWNPVVTFVTFIPSTIVN